MQALAPATPDWLGIGSGVVLGLMLTAAFLIYQRWRFAVLDAATRRMPSRHPADDERS